MTCDDLIWLFPTPMYITKYENSFDEECEFIKNLPENVEQKVDSSLIPQTENTFVLEYPELNNIKSFIEKNVDKFVKEILQSTDDFMITQSWVNKAYGGQYHPDHHHPNSVVSGVWYVSVDEDSSPIQFRNIKHSDIGLNFKEINPFNGTYYNQKVSSGTLLLFPSSLPHGVPQNTKKTERISLSFNTWFKGSFGSRKYLTYVPQN